MWVQQLAFLRYQADPVLIVQQTDAESGSGFVVRLDSVSLRARWRVPVPGFNIGTSNVVDGDLYVTCIGFVGRLSLEDGKYLWRVDDLYRRGRFSAFDTPVVTADSVVVRGTGGVLVLRRSDGAVLSALSPLPSPPN